MKTMNTNTIILIASMLIASVLPVSAQTILPWQSTSAMQATGSQHQLQVREAYAPDARYAIIPMRSTSTMMETGYIPTPDFGTVDAEDMPTIRRGFGRPGDPGDKSEESPVGEPWVLLLFAAAAAGATALRRCRRRPAAVTGQDNTPVQ